MLHLHPLHDKGQHDQVFNNPASVRTAGTSLQGIRSNLPDKDTPILSLMVTGTGQPAPTTALVAHSSGRSWIVRIPVNYTVICLSFQ